ncbi:hypothetical protein DFA_01276 [Cavenderia fasciculata]|uniref:Uncharacterized protein n=1 Tax=Cavenderia fasciculata TaxID=261658 RepID=F4PRV8_CACFS|nr:uncharacterized protein DFA_01276 [Cavenderia fasciculata]EGG21394.1 hypothetical protein DFA_01276 [Cavenderia fasciculata]|eukprot:XP_004359244.1 hypothetical protein DFA_01276 [Cavenderia fasciculata]
MKLTLVLIIGLLSCLLVVKGEDQDWNYFQVRDEQLNQFTEQVENEWLNQYEENFQFVSVNWKEIVEHLIAAQKNLFEHLAQATSKGISDYLGGLVSGFQEIANPGKHEACLADKDHIIGAIFGSNPIKVSGKDQESFTLFKKFANFLNHIADAMDSLPGDTIANCLFKWESMNLRECAHHISTEPNLAQYFVHQGLKMVQSVPAILVQVRDMNIQLLHGDLAGAGTAVGKILGLISVAVWGVPPS